MRRGYFVLVLALLACSSGEKADQPASARADTPAPAAPAPRAANEFDPAALRVGDTLMGLRVERADVRRAAAIDSSYVGDVRFAGEVTVSGRPRAHHDFPEVRTLCFDVDSTSAARLPRWPGDRRRVWFCFDNQEAAVRALGPARADTAVAPVTIAIDRYQTVRHFTDAYDTATLLRLVAP